jgi:hypothetical protein
MLMIVGCFDTYVRLPATSTLAHQHDAYVVSFLTLITLNFNMRNIIRWKHQHHSRVVIDMHNVKGCGPAYWTLTDNCLHSSRLDLILSLTLAKSR